uniref:Uncharacterized protein n=1 Tax=Eutreptiella gymnastica TaxID=73025 RepID=A0A7S1I889_9EUGL|mmetsp:Transcript_137833/g.239761  ORF Transcript_137833/g.239761 Transcript_137833/m.239761 type:complete len:135 (+) Transcript_137833:137-541(+)
MGRERQRQGPLRSQGAHRHPLPPVRSGQSFNPLCPGMPAPMHSQSPITDQQVRKRLQAKYYKAVLFGSYGRSIPFWKEVVRSLPRNRIWAVNGNDRGPFDPKGPTGIRFHLSGQVNRSTRFVRECQRQCTASPL